MMKKEDQMLKEKYERVHMREDMIKKACDTLLSNNEDIFKDKIKYIREAIYELTIIPVKTLEGNSEYKEIINKYIAQSEECDSSSIKILKKEIEYKNKLIVQLRKQNKSLGTQLLMEDKI